MSILSNKVAVKLVLFKTTYYPSLGEYNFFLQCHSGNAHRAFLGKSILSLAWMVGMLYTVQFNSFQCSTL